MNELMGLIKKYPYIESVFIHRKLGFACGDYDLKIRLVDFPHTEDTVLDIEFHTVSNFQMQNIDGMYMLWLEITDVSDRQMENIKYLVKDCENSMFSFSCNEIIYHVMKDGEAGRCV